MATYNINVQIGANDGMHDNIPSVTINAGAESLEKLAVTLTPSQVTKQITLSVPFARVKGVIISSDRNVNLFTNAANGAGGDIINVKAGNPFKWLTGGYGTNPFTVDVTTAYLTNVDNLAASVKIWILHDPVA